jgi:hypothetical protein
LGGIGWCGRGIDLVIQQQQRGASMKENLWIYAAVGVAGYFAYQYIKGKGAALIALPAPGTTTSLNQISVITPAGGEPTAGQLQSQINRLNATASEWNSAYTTLTGRSIDTLYGFNFNSVYGGLGQTTITAGAFLSMAKATGLSPHISLSGFGRSYGPVYRIPAYRWS